MNPSIADVLEHARVQDGRSVAELSRDGRVLLVFLRHLGWNFCREALADLAAVRRPLARKRVTVVAVHMGRDEDIRPLLAKAGAPDLLRVSDPDQTVYRAFGLGRAGLFDFLRPSLIKRGLQAARAGHKLGRRVGDIFQRPGTFVIEDGGIVRSHTPSDMSERPDYAALAR